MVVDAVGNFYGATFLGGSANVGVVYEISPTSNGKATEAVLYDFTGSNGDGANPIGGLIFDKAGNLYGVTQNGGAFEVGTVFELSPPASPGGAWAETVLYSFQDSPSDGAYPVAGVIFDASGNLYGTARYGGIYAPSCDFGCGVVYELTPPSAGGQPWAESILYAFQGSPRRRRAANGPTHLRPGGEPLRNDIHRR
ncbi:MAG: choice-of-anchor tandem repeat GloVer-containing protein [Terriglobales bacterium]